MNNYAEKLKDPRWQKKRLEIMQRDNFTCKLCHSSLDDGKPLNVHHLRYIKGKEPWDYPENMLITLCEECHKKQHNTAVEPFFFTHTAQLDEIYKSDIWNNTTKVLYKMLELCEYNTGKIRMTQDKVDNILKTCNMSRTSYHRGINELLSRNIISKQGHVYTIDPYMFWKGDKKTRDKLIAKEQAE